jgi:LysR family transcriptional regulator, cys regulon transcriptional activator
MNLQQLKYLRETIRCDFNLTTAAQALFTSQPGLSKAIRELEDELGAVIFKRQSKRLIGLTEEGEEIAKIAARLLTEAENLKRVASEFKHGDEGTLLIAATHTQARYTLPLAIVALRSEFPKVAIRIRQGTPTQIVAMIKQGEVDFGVATEALSQDDELTSKKLFSWRHVAVVLGGHVLAHQKKVRLKQITQYPVITYGQEFAGRSRIDAAFATAGFHPDIILEASDSDVIKTYVSMGLGVGVISELAMLETPANQLAANLVAIAFDPPLFTNDTFISYRKGRILKKYERSLVKMLTSQALASRVQALEV